MRAHVRKPILSVFCLLACFGGVVNAAGQGDFYLKPNDTVVFYGDSITDQRLYTMVTELFAVTRYPKLNVRFVHSGWGGDRVSGGGGGPIDVRLERDVFAYHPTVITIMLGMNDGHYVDNKPADDEAYFTGYKHIIESLRQTIPNLRITAIGPSPFDDVTRPLTLQPNGYNAVLVKYSDWLRKYGAENKFDFADLNTGVVGMLGNANKPDSAVAQKILPDRVHPALSGHLIMAEQLLKAWNARPTVSAVTIDAKSREVARNEFAQVSDVKKDEPLSWSETEEALPLPFFTWLAEDRDHSMALAIHSSDVTEALNQETLRITNLRQGRYKLTIDGQDAGVWDAKEWDTGVNLAVIDTPMSKQAAAVRDLTVLRINIHQARWRTLQVPLQNVKLEHLQESLKSLDAVDANLAEQQRATAQPVPHKYQLSREQ